MEGVDRSRQHFLERLFTSLLAITFVIVAARLYSRFLITKNAQLDDYVAFVAWVFVSAQSSMDLVNSTYGVGLRIKDVEPSKYFRILNLLTTGTLFSCICLTLVRLSIVAFYRRLQNTKFYNIFLIALAAPIAIVGIVTIFLFCFQCNPAIGVWHRATSNCINRTHEQNILVAFSLCGLVFDIALLMLPVWLVSIQMNSPKKAFRVALVFSSGVFVIAIDIIRVIILFNTDLSSDFTWRIVPVLSWIALEEHVGLWAACFPAIFSLIRVTWDSMSSKRSSSTGSYFFSTSIRRPKVRQGQRSDLESGYQLQDVSGLCNNAGNIEGHNGLTGAQDAKTSIHGVENSSKLGKV